MRYNFTLLLFLFSFATPATAQDGTLLNGKVVVKDATAGNVYVINVTNEKETITNNNGEFTILVQVDDVLVFSGEHLDFMRKIVEQEHIDSDSFTVEMTSKTITLDEVEVTNFTALGLGILTKPAKQYTPAERRLYGATSTPIDALLNAISGRTKLLKNDVKTEQKEFMLQALDGLYPDSFYENDLQIAKENIKGFHYFIVEEPKFAEAMKSNNATVASFMIIEMALKFKTVHTTDED